MFGVYFYMLTGLPHEYFWEFGLCCWAQDLLIYKTLSCQHEHFRTLRFVLQLIQFKGLHMSSVYSLHSVCGFVLLILKHVNTSKWTPKRKSVNEDHVNSLTKPLILIFVSCRKLTFKVPSSQRSCWLVCQKETTHRRTLLSWCGLISLNTQLTFCTTRWRSSRCRGG